MSLNFWMFGDFLSSPSVNISTMWLVPSPQNWVLVSWGTNSRLRCYGNSGLSRRPMQQMITKGPTECVMCSCLCVQQVRCCSRSSWGQNTAKRTFCSGWPAKTTRRCSTEHKWRPPQKGSTPSLCRSTPPDRWGFYHFHTESPFL